MQRWNDVAAVRGREVLGQIVCGPNGTIAEAMMGKIMQAGANAFRAGLPATANPYNDTWHQMHWRMGWIDAAVDAGVLTRY